MKQALSLASWDGAPWWPHGCSGPAPACSPSIHLPLSGLQTRPDSRLLPLDTNQGPWGRALFCFCKKVTNRGLLPGVASHRKCSGGQRKERAPAPRKLLFVRQARSSRQHHLSRLQQQPEEQVFSALSTRGKSGWQGPVTRARPRPPGLLEGAGRGRRCQAGSCPAIHTPRSPVQGAQWVKPALPWHQSRGLSGRLTRRAGADERRGTKLTEHFGCISKCEPGNRDRSAALLALPRGSWALKSLLCCHPGVCLIRPNAGPHHAAPEPCNLRFSSLLEHPHTPHVEFL